MDHQTPNSDFDDVYWNTKQPTAATAGCASQFRFAVHGLAPRVPEFWTLANNCV